MKISKTIRNNFPWAVLPIENYRWLRKVNIEESHRWKQMVLFTKTRYIDGWNKAIQQFLSDFISVASRVSIFFNLRLGKKNKQFTYGNTLNRFCSHFTCVCLDQQLKTSSHQETLLYLALWSRHTFTIFNTSMTHIPRYVIVFLPYLGKIMQSPNIKGNRPLFCACVHRRITLVSHYFR